MFVARRSITISRLLIGPADRFSGLYRIRGSDRRKNFESVLKALSMQDRGKIDADCIFFGTLAGLGVSNSDGGGTVNLDASGKADSAVAKKAASQTKAVSCL